MSVFTSTKQTAIESVGELKNKMQEMKSNFINSSKDLLKECCLQIFKDCPKLVAIQWQQWIPGFNDGDPCEFSTNFSDCEVLCVVDTSDIDKLCEEDYKNLVNIRFDADLEEILEEDLTISWEEEPNPCYQEGDGDWRKTRWYLITDNGVKLYSPYKLSGDEYKSYELKTLHDFIKAFNDHDILESLFGSDSQITILRTGEIHVDEYDCGR